MNKNNFFVSRKDADHCPTKATTVYYYVSSSKCSRIRPMKNAVKLCTEIYRAVHVGMNARSKHPSRTQCA